MIKEDEPIPIAGSYLIDGKGISVNRCLKETDSFGRPIVNYYYPQLKADAFEYARAFNQGFVTISRTISHICCI